MNKIITCTTILTIFINFIGYVIMDTFKIGGLFNELVNDTKTLEQIMFEIAVDSMDRLNFNGNGLNEEDRRRLTLIQRISNIERYDAVQAEHHVCEMLDDSVIGIFGPQSRETSPIVKSICDVKEIPHIQTRYDVQQKRSTCGINLYPHPSTLSKAYTDVIKKLGWSSFIIIYEDNESLIRISELLKPNRNLSVEIKQLPNSDDYRDVFRYIIHSDEVNILLDCSTGKLPEVLKQAQQIGAMIEKYNYIVTCLDLSTLDLDPYKYSGVKIYGFRLINPLKSYVSEMLLNIKSKLQNYGDYDTEKILVEAALMYDAVILFGKTLQEKYLALPTVLSNKLDTTDIKFITDETVPHCYDKNSWKFGFSIISDIKVAEMKGLTGLIKFDYEGFRTNIELQVIELTENGIKEKGVWNSSHEEKMMFNDEPELISVEDFTNTTFRVIIPMTKPFGMRKRLPSLLHGNERFEGYAVDLLRELSLLYNFKYEILIQENGANGQKQISENGTEYWDGMMGALLTEIADLAIGDLTITKERSEYVEFSSPFMELGIAILFIKPAKENPSLFSFLFPFSDIVWYLVITAGLSMALQLYIMARISPYEWGNPYPCIQDPKELENQFTLSNALWFTLGALMQQGSDVAPVSASTRIAAGIWWFFTLIMVSSYTANLAAFLTVENEVSPFADAFELSRKTNTIHCGAKLKGTTTNFFKDSQIQEYKDIYEFMITHPDDMTTTNEDGVRKVLEEKGKYAFFMESSAIEYEKEQHCELAQIGPLLDDQWYSNSFSSGILLLQEKGILTALKRKWWKEKYSKNCQEDKKNDADQLKLANVGGVFLVLIAGVVIAFIAMICELVLSLKAKQKSEKIRLRHELAHEMKFILKCKSVKPVRKSDEKSLLGSQSEANHSGPMNDVNQNSYRRTENELSDTY